MNTLSYLFKKHRFGKVRLGVLKSWCEKELEASTFLDFGKEEQYYMGSDDAIKRIIKCIDEAIENE